METQIHEAGAIPAQMPYADSKLERIDLHFDERSCPVGVEMHEVMLRDARRALPGPTLEEHGFALLDWPSEVVRSHREELVRENAAPSEVRAPINDRYCSELAPLIAEVSGAREVFAQYDTITVRFSAAARETSWMTTAAFAHIDFTPGSIDRLLADTLDLTGREVAPYRRQVIFQAWRVITAPPQDAPLAICDQRSMRSGDVIPMDFHGPEGTRNESVQSLAGRYGPHHQWYYYPDMRPEEVLLFKGYDSDESDVPMPMHTSFRDVHARDPVPRGSIECRFIALYD